MLLEAVHDTWGCILSGVCDNRTSNACTGSGGAKIESMWLTSIRSIAARTTLGGAQGAAYTYVCAWMCACMHVCMHVCR